MKTPFLLLAGTVAALAQTPTVGQPAPTARLNDHAGNAVTVPVSGAWTVLAFYPKAATPG